MSFSPTQLSWRAGWASRPLQTIQRCMILLDQSWVCKTSWQVGELASLGSPAHPKLLLYCALFPKFPISRTRLEKTLEKTESSKSVNLFPSRQLTTALGQSITLPAARDQPLSFWQEFIPRALHEHRIVGTGPPPGSPYAWPFRDELQPHRSLNQVPPRFYLPAWAIALVFSVSSKPSAFPFLLSSNKPEGRRRSTGSKPTESAAPICVHSPRTYIPIYRPTIYHLLPSHPACILIVAIRHLHYNKTHLASEPFNPSSFC